MFRSISEHGVETLRDRWVRRARNHAFACLSERGIARRVEVGMPEEVARKQLKVGLNGRPWGCPPSRTSGIWFLSVMHAFQLPIMQQYYRQTVHDENCRKVFSGIPGLLGHRNPGGTKH